MFAGTGLDSWPNEKGESRCQKWVRCLREGQRHVFGAVHVNSAGLGKEKLSLPHYALSWALVVIIWKHLNAQLRQKGEMGSLQTLEARITVLRIAMGCDVLKLTFP